jgi:hypothetical protein
MYSYSRAGGSVVLITAICMLAATCVSADYLPRRGFVTLQFDDSHSQHFDYIFPMLELYGFKGTFAFITETSDLGIENGMGWAVQQMYAAGHEIQDHTTRHDHMWATLVDTLDDGITEWIPYTFANIAIWDSLCDRSLFILDSLGITVTGWNQPGGTKPGKVPGHPEWRTASRVNDSLYAVIASKYEYAMGNWGVHSFNAHLNLRGHIYPQRFPFFNVPHVMIDYLSVEEIKTGIADAVASGLWYCAVDHAYTMEEVSRMDTVMSWLYDKEIEVVRCCEGRDRIQFRFWDPLENQLPQARMLTDLDENGKPDGYAGACAWDTTTSPPVDSCRCCRIWGGTDWTCYGPEVGDNSFSIWVRSADSTDASFSIAYANYDFDWGILSSKVTTVQCSHEWTHIDASLYPKLLFAVEDEVDRTNFRIMNVAEGDTIIVAYPEFVLSDIAGIGGNESAIGAPVSPMAVPNPVRLGTPVAIGPCGDLGVYDVLGRQIMDLGAAYGQEGLVIDTSRLGPGVFLVRPHKGGPAAKVIVLP